MIKCQMLNLPICMRPTPRKNMGNEVKFPHIFSFCNRMSKVTPFEHQLLLLTKWFPKLVWRRWQRGKRLPLPRMAIPSTDPKRAGCSFQFQRTVGQNQLTITSAVGVISNYHSVWFLLIIICNVNLSVLQHISLSANRCV